MLRSEDDIRLMDDADCFIMRKNNVLRIKNGVIYDPSSSGSPVSVDFFQMNKSRKMVHIDYNDVMIQLANIRTRCSKRSRHKKRLHSLHESDLLKTIKDLQEKVALVTEQLAHVLPPEKPMSFQRKELMQKSRLSVSEQKTKEKISPIPKITTERKDSSESMFSDSNEQIESFPAQNFNNSKHIHNGKLQSTNSESETDLSNLHSSHDSGQLKRIVEGPLRVGQAAVQIDAETLLTIGLWASRNRDFFPYKGMTCVPEGTFENDDEYFLKLLSMLNPTVQISTKLASAIRIASSIPSNFMSQDEFSKTIGLVRVSNIRNHECNDSYSEINNSQSRLLRKRTSKGNETMKLPRSVSDQPKEKSSLPNLGSNLDKKKEKINGTNDSTSSGSNFDLTKPNKSIKLRSGLKKILPKVTVTNARILRDHRSNYTEEEDRIILDWVLKDDHSVKVKGNKIWIQLEKKGIKPGIVRTWQSLRNRFIKTILCQLGMYGLEYSEMMRLRKGAVRGSIKTKLNTLYNPNYASVLSNKTGRKNPAAPAARSPKKAVTGYENNYSQSENTKNISNNTKKPYMSGSALQNNFLTRKLFNDKTFVALSDASSL